MKPGEGWSCRWEKGWLGLLLCLSAGCVAGGSQVDQALLAKAEPPADKLAEHYLLGCPDVLEVTVAGRPNLSGRRAIDVDGCIELGVLGRLRVEGLSPAQVARQVAAAAELPPDQVQVRVAEYRSQQVYLFGQVVGLQQAVVYQGPETVLQLLQRVGGITPGAAPGDVYVVRGHIAQGAQAEVFHVDLRAILLDHDPRTNIRLQPCDQVYVDETRLSSLERCVPPVFRPVYEKLFGLTSADMSAPMLD